MPMFARTAHRNTVVLLTRLLLACTPATIACDSEPEASTDRDAGSKEDAATHDAATHDAATSDAATHDAATHDEKDAARDQDAASDADAGATPAESKGHLIVVTERESPETSLQYAHILERWPENGKLDYSQAIELGEFVTVNALQDALLVYQPEEGTVRKLVVAADGSIADDVTVSFAAKGVMGSTGDMIYVSPTRAYFLDEASAQFVIWNPKTMEVEGAFDLDKDVLTRSGFAAQISRGIALKGEGFVSASWRDWDTLEYHDAAAIGVFDATSNEPKLEVIEDDRCASTVTTPFEGGDGFVYLVSDAALGFDAIANPMRTEKALCALRIRPGAGKFDPDFFVDLKEVLGSPGFYAVHPMKDGKLLVNLWAPDVEVASVASKDDPNWYWDYPPYFEFAIVDLAKGSTTPVPELGRAAVQWSLDMQVDGETYVQTYRDDEGSDLKRVDGDGSVTTVLSNGRGTDVQYLGRVSR
jgi:hypothetical protein